MTTKGTKEWAGTNVNFCTGCYHNCSYCYAKRIRTRFDPELKETWSDQKVRTEVLERNYRKRSKPVMVPSSHDIIDRPDVISAAIIVIGKLLAAGNEVIIVTKSGRNVIRQLMDAFEDYKDQLLFRFSITTSDDNLTLKYEPNAPFFVSRLLALKEAYSRGFQTSVSIEPFLSGPLLTFALVEKWVTEFVWIGPMSNPMIELKPLYTKEHLQKIHDGFHSMLVKSPDAKKKLKFKDAFLSKIESKTSNVAYTSNGEYVDLTNFTEEKKVKKTSIKLKPGKRLKRISPPCYFCEGWDRDEHQTEPCCLFGDELIADPSSWTYCGAFVLYEKADLNDLKKEAQALLENDSIIVSKRQIRVLLEKLTSPVTEDD
ncbi:MAG: radical SAM protein [Candidatus Kariarchaeaceae archaeon]